MFENFIRQRTVASDTKIAMLIMDGLGGLPLEPGGKTELETALTPNMDALAARSALGLSMPVGPGITSGSGPGHLALFGYDPIENEIGRGVLEALGVDFEVGPHDVAARGNFCTIDANGILTDRRAGRLPTEASTQLVKRLRTIKIAGVEIFIEPVKEHRFAFILRCQGLGAKLTESDPLKTGVETLPVNALHSDSQRTAEVVNEFLRQARDILKDEHPANMIMLRGFAKFPTLPVFADIYKLNSAAIAINGMYRGVARLAGMQVLDVFGNDLAAEFSALEDHWQEHDFFYLHFKKTDTCGESGDFSGKVKAIEEFDAQLPRLLALNPDVVIIGGDHSSPALLRSHSWHPVPLMLYSKYVREDGIASFGERVCAAGSLGTIPAKHIMPLALANAGRVAKYGA